MTDNIKEEIKKINKELKNDQHNLSYSNKKHLLKTLEAILREENNYRNTATKFLLEKAEILKDTDKTMSNFNEDKYIIELFALVRELSRRTLGMFPYPVQILGSLSLYYGYLIEMKTGEGKTLTGAVTAAVKGLEGLRTHIITTNEYLVVRDLEQMKPLYDACGLNSTYVISEDDLEVKQNKYKNDIIYVTASQVGFDYLKDNLTLNVEEIMLPNLDFVVIDEIDSILLDEASTNLRIAGSAKEDTYYAELERLKTIDRFVKSTKHRELTKEELEVDSLDLLFIDEEEHFNEDVDVLVNKKNKTTLLTDKGVEKAEKFFGLDNLSDLENIELNHLLNNSLKVNYTFERDIDYLVDEEEGTIVSIDVNTGRAEPDRRFSDGIHEALEIKEKVNLKEETETLNSITLQHFFMKYDKMSGQSGTLFTDKEEFLATYKLPIIKIPTNKPVIREDLPDLIFKTKEEKYKAIVEKVKELNKKGQPVLIGTPSVEVSEIISKKLKKEGLGHNLLNAKNHKNEAFIVSQAGKKNSITVATNMAGRGTDIKLGGDFAEDLKGYLFTLVNYLITEYNPFTDFVKISEYIVSRILEPKEKESPFDVIGDKSWLYTIDDSTFQTVFNEVFKILHTKVFEDNNENYRELIQGISEGIDTELTDDNFAYLNSLLNEYIIYALDFYAIQMVQFKEYIDTFLNDIQEQMKKDKEEVLKLGGLYIIGVERSITSRVDNQLRGRAGRQGDRGYSQFYVSLEDDFLKLYSFSTVYQKMLNEEKDLNTKEYREQVLRAQKFLESTRTTSRIEMLKNEVIIDEHRKIIGKDRLNILKRDYGEFLIDYIKKEVNSYIDEEISFFKNIKNKNNIIDKIQKLLNIEITIVNKKETEVRKEVFQKIEYVFDYLLVNSNIEDVEEPHIIEELEYNLTKRKENLLILINELWVIHLTEGPELMEQLRFLREENLDVKYNALVTEHFNDIQKEIEDKIKEDILFFINYNEEYV